MSSLTSQVKDKRSPVTVWLCTTFPEVREVRVAFRVDAGAQRVLMRSRVVPAAQGAAIDWWPRMLVDEAVSIDLALAGLPSRRAPCLRTGTDLPLELGGGIDRDRKTVGRMDPRRVRRPADAVSYPALKSTESLR